MSHDYIFNSERLGFRLWKPKDRQPFLKMCSDPEVMEYFPKLLSEEEVDITIERISMQFSKTGYGLYAIDLLFDGSFIGFVGLQDTLFAASFTPCVEIGWRINKSNWGQGLATEGAIRCLSYARVTLKIPEVFSFTAVQNLRSERVMQKIGMSKVGIFDHPKLESDHWLCKHVLYHFQL